jgi:hypothetical protein
VSAASPLRRTARGIGVLFALECALVAANVAVPGRAERVEREIGQAGRWIGTAPARWAVARANRDARWLAHRVAPSGAFREAGEPPGPVARGVPGYLEAVAATLRTVAYGALFRLELWLGAIGWLWWAAGAALIDAWCTRRLSSAARPMVDFRHRHAARRLVRGYPAALAIALQWPWVAHPAAAVAVAGLAVPILWLAVRTIRDE